MSRPAWLRNRSVTSEHPPAPPAKGRLKPRRPFSRPAEPETTQNRHKPPERRFFSNFFLLKINTKVLKAK
nr:MAG TPA: hypothetical protein [Caudoviricetes sp.]